MRPNHSPSNDCKPRACIASARSHICGTGIAIASTRFGAGGARAWQIALAMNVVSRFMVSAQIHHAGRKIGKRAAKVRMQRYACSVSTIVLRSRHCGCAGDAERSEVEGCLRQRIASLESPTISVRVDRRWPHASEPRRGTTRLCAAHSSRRARHLSSLQFPPSLLLRHNSSSSTKCTI